jgi:hypothetical protein
MFSLFPHVMFVFEEYLLDTATAVWIAFYAFVVEDVCEGCFDLLLVA